jgi:hypothetical protein
MGFFWIFSFYVRYSTLLHLLTLRIQCVGDCWDLTRTVPTTELAVRRYNHIIHYNCDICPLPDGRHLAVGSLTRLAQVGAARGHLRAEPCLPQLNLQVQVQINSVIQRAETI